MSLDLCSIVIVNYNGSLLLENCIRSVLAQDYPLFEVIVVDNCSTDDSVRRVRESFPDMRIVVAESNLGFSGGNNRGVTEAQGDYIVLLNNDTVVEQGWLSALIEMIRHMNGGVVTSKVITDGVPAEFYEMNGTINYLGYNIMREFANLSQVFFAGGASLMFRKSEVGLPFPDEYFLYHEDVFLSWRMRLLGKSVGMAQQSVVHHRGSATTKRQASRFVTFYQERNRLLNALLLYETRAPVLLVPYLLADAVAKLLLSIVSGRKSLAGILQGYGWIVNNYGWVKQKRGELQAQRKVSDREVMSMMSCKVIDGGSRPAKLLNRLSRLYAQTVGLAFHE